jgi:hypothetical protein
MFDDSLPEVCALPALEDAALVAAASGWAQVEAAAAARKLAVMAELFRRRTGLDDAVDRELWFVDAESSVSSELAAAQNITDGMALAQAHRGVLLRDRLPRVAALFEAGLVSDMLVRTIVFRTALVADPEAMAAVDAALAEQVSSWGPKSLKKTEAAIDALIELYDPAAVRRAKAADKSRSVHFGSPTDEAGYMTLWARMYSPDGVALEQRVEEMARSVCRDDPRTMDERRSDAFGAIAVGRALMCECDNDECRESREWPAKDVVIHVVATDAALAEAQSGGAEVQAEVREKPSTDSDPKVPAEAQSGGAEVKRDEQPSVNSKPIPRKPCPAPAFVIGGGVADTGVLAAFLHRAKIRPIAHPGKTAPEQHYRPSAALQEFVRCRDLTCRFPHCDKPATVCDLDHTVPYPAGPTSASNLKCLCRKHHLLKTFWAGAGGWHDEQRPDGTIIWTSPAGQTYLTQPGSAVLFPRLCAPTATAPIDPIADGTSADRGVMMPRRRRTRAQDRHYRIEVERRRNDEFVAERNKPPPF